MVWGAKAAWGAGSTTGDRARLPKGNEPCHICGEDSMCEVKLKPCNHEMCLSCCNTMRQGIVFKADAGLKCPFCREYVDGFTDMNGRPDTIPDLVEANRAAHKSRVARKTGMDKAVSTGVPDPQRLVPPIGRSTSTASHAAAAASEPGWTCPACRRTNAAGKAECTHCRTPHPDRALGPVKDLLTCSDDEVARTLCERSHAALYRSLQDAGMPHDKVGGSLGGNGDSIRQALRARRHERLMKAAHVLAAPMYCERVATHEWGNYAVQHVLEGAHRVRMEASTLQQQDALPPENFSWAPSSGSSSGSSGGAAQPMAMTAFSKLLGTLTSASMLHNLCMSEQGVHVLVRLIKLSSPPETAYILNQIMHDLADMVTTKGGALVVCSLIDRLSVAANCDNAGVAERATASIVRLCGHLCQHHRSLQQCARHQYLGPKVVELLQCGLPAADAFKMGYELVLNAPALAATRHGCRTLQMLTEIRTVDARSREMLRDIVCYTSKTLQGHFGQLATKGETGGPALVRALLDFLLADREDDWVVQITKELVAAGTDLRRDREAQELLVHSLALPLWRPPEIQQHWAVLQAGGVDVAVLKPKVDAARQHQPRLRERVLPSLSEVQPSSLAESVRRFPHYLRDGGQAVRNSALRKQPPPPPPREQDQQQQQQPKAAPPGFGAAAAAASASAAGPAAAKVPPPGFAAAQSAAPAAAPATVTFPNGTSVPMPQPYSASSSSSAAPAPSASRAAAAEPKQQASSAPAAAAPVASKPVPPPAPQQPVAAAAPAPVPAPSPLKPAAPPQHAAPMPRPAPMQPAAAPQVQAPVQQPAAAPRAPPPVPQPALVQPPPVAARPAVPVPPPAAPGMNAAARPFAPPAARPLPPHLQPQLQQQQQPAPAPAHLQALPPHLRQPAPAAAGSSAGLAGMPAPITPVPTQHPAGGYAQPPAPQQLLQQLLGNAAPRPAAPAPAPPAVRPPALGMVPPPQQAAAAQGSSAAFDGYGSLTEMLSELTAAAAPQPVAPPRPAYRPAYRPPGAVAYRPPTATALPPAPTPAPAAAPAPRPVGVPAPSPAARFPMPGAPRPAPPPAAAPAAPAAPARPAAPAVPVAAATTWDCKVCTYRHEGAESQFLSCAMCGSPQS